MQSFFSKKNHSYTLPQQPKTQKGGGGLRLFAYQNTFLGWLHPVIYSNKKGTNKVFNPCFSPFYF